MSAIAALVDRAPDEDPSRSPLLHAMLDRMQHRGPDARGIVEERGVALGLGLLATTPEDDQLSARVPQRHGAVILAADARLDNRDELLSACGSDPNACDAALILDSYRRWGVEAARHLRGDFAFVLWDAQQRRLYAARDHLGLRPLYIHDDGRRLRLASEPQAFFADPAVPKRPNLEAISLYIADTYGEDGDTLYEGITALPPGHEMVATAGSTLVRRYWELDPARRLPDERSEAIAEQLFDALARATRARLRSNRPLALSLSGGTDSASVASMAEHERRQGHGHNEPLTALHLIFPGLDCDESRYARMVTAHWDLPLVEIDAVARASVYAPSPGSQPVDIYYAPHFLSELAHQVATEHGIRSVLTGQGGDVLLRPTGVEWADHLRRGRIDRVVDEARRLPDFATAGRVLWREGLRHLVPWRLRRALQPPARAVRRLRRRHAGQMSAWADEVVREDSRARARRLGPPEAYPSPVARAMVAGIHGPGLSSHIARWDRLAARHGHEERHPFLDVELVELLLAVPHELRHEFARDKPKPILRQALAPLLPDGIRSRPDSAEYSCYVRRALFADQGKPLRALFERSKLVELGILPPDTAKAVSDGDSSIPLPMVVTSTAMEIWLRQLSF